MSKEKCKHKRLPIFVLGFLFALLVVGAASYFVPILDCPSCENVEAGPEVSHDAKTVCVDCDNMHTMTFWEYLKLSDVRVKMPKVSIPSK